LFEVFEGCSEVTGRFCSHSIHLAKFTHKSDNLALTYNSMKTLRSLKSPSAPSEEECTSLKSPKVKSKKRLLPRLWKSNSASDSLAATEASISSSLGPSEVIRRSAVIATLPLEVEVVLKEESSCSGDETETPSTFPETIPATPLQRSFQEQAPQPGETSSDSIAASRHFEKALAFCSTNHFDQALSHVQQGSDLVHETNPLYPQLLTIQAEVLGRQGDYQSSLDTFQRVLDLYREQSAPIDVTDSLYYACGRLSVYLQKYSQALEYYTQELLLTRAVSGDSLAVARIYHDLATVAEKGLGDWTRALVYYEQALFVEAVVCQQQGDDWKEAAQQIPKTKKCMGRIQFALGNIDEAMRLSNHRFSLR
jgi:hypothetical protein